MFTLPLPLAVLVSQQIRKFLYFFFLRKHKRESHVPYVFIAILSDDQSWQLFYLRTILRPLTVTSFRPVLKR